MVWYLDTSAFLKLLVLEDESPALRAWCVAHDSLWSSHLLRTEALRAASRLGIDRAVVDEAVASVSLILPSSTTYVNAGLAEPSSIRSLDALHLASALELGEDLEGIVAYDDRLIEAARRNSVRVVTPGWPE